ncbi:MAG: 50S ribosomal protein L3 [Candidatus Yonathbacteria bacterium]|nr:50S ribosomal protein L3 [Candidatus Yonathbacteria bacterium]
MKFILGTKEEMSQIFTEEGIAIPVTLLSAGPVVVTQVKTDEKDGYEAVQVGYGVKNPRNINKAQTGHFKGLGNFRYVKEFRTAQSGIKVGDSFDVSSFEPGDVVEVSGVSKGKGFQGVVKRHGFHGGPRTHGQKHSEREPGSIGATGPQRVFKGTRMGGRMGADRVTVKRLKVVAIDKENNVMAISGAIPGRRGTVIEITG